MARFADVQVTAVVRGARAPRTVAFPGREGVVVAVRLLTDQEIDDCRLRAFAALKKGAEKNGWDVATLTDVDPDLLARMQTREIIARAFIDSETTENEKPTPFFSSADEVGREVDAPTVELLFTLYLEHQSFVAPLKSASEEEVKALAEALGKAPPASVLAAFDRSTLVRLCTSLASALRSRT
jgi:hypothetical protein